MNFNSMKRVQQIRGEKTGCLSPGGSPYRMDILERDATASYLFSIPIRHKSGALWEGRWYPVPAGFCARGVMDETKITVTSGEIRLATPRSAYTLVLPTEIEWEITDGQLSRPDMRLSLTPCGVCVRFVSQTGSSCEMKLKTTSIFDGVRASSQFFSLMKSHYVPAVTVSPLGAVDTKGIWHPLRQTYRKAGPLEYTLSWQGAACDNAEIVFEMNLHEEKKFQDTTVSESVPGENNVFGSAAYLGNAEVYGAQRLYLKCAPSLGAEFHGKRIRQVRLILPRHTAGASPVEAWHMDKRFCSFGSRWDRRMPYSQSRLPVSQEADCVIVDLSEKMIDAGGRLVLTNGVLLKSTREQTDGTAVSTGDSCIAPVILEVRSDR